MAAPVPKVDLIAGKFVVVASIGMLSAVLNLLSIGGTVYLGGLGDVLAKEGGITIPLRTLPLVLVTLIRWPSCSVPCCSPFAVLPAASGSPELHHAGHGRGVDSRRGRTPARHRVGRPAAHHAGDQHRDPDAPRTVHGRDQSPGVLWVTLSTCIYALAAVEVAAKLFGQEAVLFADSRLSGRCSSASSSNRPTGPALASFAADGGGLSAELLHPAVAFPGRPDAWLASIWRASRSRWCCCWRRCRSAWRSTRVYASPRHSRFHRRAGVGSRPACASGYRPGCWRGVDVAPGAHPAAAAGLQGSRRATSRCCNASRSPPCYSSSPFCRPSAKNCSSAAMQPAACGT